VYVLVAVTLGVGVGVGQAPSHNKLQSNVSLSGVVGLAGPASTKIYLPVVLLKQILSVPFVSVLRERPHGPA
jgi:hypothetical protein